MNYDIVCRYCGKEVSNINASRCQESPNGKHAYLQCEYCGQVRRDIKTDYCSKSPNGDHAFRVSPHKHIGSNNSSAYNAGANVGTALGDWLFSTPASLVGVIVRSVLISGLIFWISDNISMSVGVGVAAFGLYFWLVKRNK